MACIHVNLKVAIADHDVSLISIMLRSYADQRHMQLVDAELAGDTFAAQWARDSKRDAESMAAMLETLLDKRINEIADVAQSFADIA